MPDPVNHRAARSDPQPDLPTFGDVLVPRRVAGAFTYAIPPALRSRLRIGSLVLVPFGPTTLSGVVVSLAATGPDTSAGKPFRQIRSLLDRSPDLPAVPLPLVELTRETARECVAPSGQCLRLVLPRTAERHAPERYRLADPGRGPEGKTPRLSPAARAVLTALASAPDGLGRTTLQRAIPGPVSRTLAALTRRGYIETLPASGPDQDEPPADPPHSCASPLAPPSVRLQGGGPAFTVAVAPVWWGDLLTALDERRQATYLLEGPAPARWTIGLDAAEASLSRGRPALMLVPEQASVAALALLARARFGNRVTLLHGGLSDQAHADAWWRIREGTAHVVIGTRSAVFAPLPSLGLIWVDDESDPSLKEEQEPHYHAREVARLRAHRQDAVLLLSSAHLSVETLQTAARSTAPALATMSPAARPAIEVVDLRTLPPRTLFSEPLLAGLRTALDAKSGAILFLNRKGFASALLCRDCGETPRCRRCSVVLTFYRTAGRLACHYCGATLPLPDTCPSCLAPRLEPIGVGTERLEAELRREFPQARIARLDRDSARTPAQAEALRRQAAAGAVDILVGTQMLFQGPPLPPAGFVGVPHADAGLHRPDFRAAERLYHALLDAASLARPGAEGGRVVLQTHLPGQPAIAALVHGTPATFVETELAFRRALGYPPFTRLIALHVTGKDEAKVRATAGRWAALLTEVSPRDVQILGPIPAPVAMARGRHRWQILLKSEDRAGVRQAVEATLERVRLRVGRSLRLDVDVDPVEMT